MPSPSLTAAYRAELEWLASADDHDRVTNWWKNAGVAMLNVGMRWDVVKVGADQGRRAVDALPSGSAMCDPVDGYVYVFVPLNTSATWDVPGTECLDRTCWLWVPSPERASPAGPYWLRLDGLADPAQLRLLLRHGVTHPDDESEQATTAVALTTGG